MTEFFEKVFSLAFRRKKDVNPYTFDGGEFPLPVRHEWGEGQANENGLLSPTLSSIVPLEEREQAPFAFDEQFCPALSSARPLSPFLRLAAVLTLVTCPGILQWLIPPTLFPSRTRR